MYGQFIDGNGALLGPEILLSKDLNDPTKAAAMYQEYASVAFNPDDGELMIVWMDDRETTVGVFKHDVWGQRLKWDGTRTVFVGNNFPVYKSPVKSENPEIAYDEKNKEYLVVWAEIVSETEKTPKAIRLSRNGTTIGSAFDIDGAISHPAYPDVEISDRTGERMVTYEKGNTSGKLYAFSGQNLGSFSVQPWAYIRPTVVYNRFTGEFMVVYSGTSGGFERLYYMRLMAGTSATATPVPSRAVTATPTTTRTPTQTPTNMPTNTPTRTPTPTSVPTNTTAPTATPTLGRCECPAGKVEKRLGNANCDEVVDMIDFSVWVAEFSEGSVNNADFDCNGMVDLGDYQTWLSGFAGS